MAQVCPRVFLTEHCLRAEGPKEGVLPFPNLRATPSSNHQNCKRHVIHFPAVIHPLMDNVDEKFLLSRHHFPLSM